MNTMTTRKTRFTTAKGNAVEVFSTWTTERNVTGFVGRRDVVRTFAVVNGTTEVDVTPGEAFQAPVAVREAGF